MSDWVTQLIGHLGYLGIAILMLAETVFPPLPSEIIMPLAGLEVAQGRLDFYLVVLSGTAGAMAGNVAWFAAARALGVKRFRGFVERRGRWLAIHWADVERARLGMEKRGAFVVAIGRLIPTIRSVVSIPAGLLRMRWMPFLVWSAIGTGVWTAALTIGGVALGQRYELIASYVGPVSIGVTVVLIAFYAWRVATWRADAPK